MPLSVGAMGVLKDINKKMGDGTIFLGSEMVVPRRYTSGSLSLDVALGGGWPGNHWVEVIGRESAGKTAVVLKTVAANQRLDPEFATMWVAGEHFDEDQANALGVDISRVAVVPTQDMEFALQIMLAGAESKEFDCIILDSFPALLPASEDEKAMDEFTVADGAKIFNKYWRKAGKATRRSYKGDERPMIGIIINQYRDKIGGFSPRGVPQTTPGGHGKDYAYYARLEVVRSDYLKEKRGGNDVMVGQTIKMTTIKNKSAAPRQVAQVDFYFRDAPTRNFRRGDYDLGKEYVALGILFGVIKKSGGWFYYDGRKWNGQPSVQVDVLAEPQLRDQLGAEVIEIAKNPHLADRLEESA